MSRTSHCPSSRPQLLIETTDTIFKCHSEYLA